MVDEQWLDDYQKVQYFQADLSFPSFGKTVSAFLVFFINGRLECFAYRIQRIRGSDWIFSSQNPNAFEQVLKETLIEFLNSMERNQKKEVADPE